MSNEDKVLYVEDCKHAGDDDLVVERNDGIRWVTCTACHATFVREEFYEDAVRQMDYLRDAIIQHRAARADELSVFGRPSPAEGGYGSVADRFLWAVLDFEGTTP